MKLVGLGILVLTFFAAAPVIAYPYCSEISCSSLLVPCDALCWECSGDDSGPEHHGDTIYDPDYCAHPYLLTVRDMLCPCIESSAAAPSLSDFLQGLAEPSARLAERSSC